MTSKGSSKHSSGVTATTIYTKTEIEKLIESLNIDGINAEIKNLQNQKNLNKNTIYSLTKDVVSLKAFDKDVGTKTENNIRKIENNIRSLDSLSTRGTWCAKQDSWDWEFGVITYKKFTISDSNMGSNQPLSLATGI